MKVELRITGAANHASASRKSLPFARVEGRDIIIRSPLTGATLNDHLVWLWDSVKLERRFLKSLQTEGASITVVATEVGGPFEIKPNGAEMLHLIGATLSVSK